MSLGASWIQFPCSGIQLSECNLSSGSAWHFYSISQKRIFFLDGGIVLLFYTLGPLEETVQVDA